VDFSGAIKRGEFVVEQAREQHEAIRGQLQVARRPGLIHRFGVKHRLRHGGILSPSPRASNVSFGAENFRSKKSSWPIAKNRVQLERVDSNRKQSQLPA
jgi:hypothetical protein